MRLRFNEAVRKDHFFYHTVNKVPIAMSLGLTCRFCFVSQ